MLYNTQEIDICYTMGYAFVYASPTSVFEVILEMDYSETQTPLLWRETYKLPEGHHSPCALSYLSLSYHILLPSLTTISYYHLSLSYYILLPSLTIISYYHIISCYHLLLSSLAIISYYVQTYNIILLLQLAIISYCYLLLPSYTTISYYHLLLSSPTTCRPIMSSLTITTCYHLLLLSLTSILYYHLLL
jgi:hypothetical protein